MLYWLFWIIKGASQTQEPLLKSVLPIYRTNKTIVVYHEQKTPVNIMLTESTQAYLTSLSALETYDFKQQKRIAYVGEYI